MFTRATRFILLFVGVLLLALAPGCAAQEEDEETALSADQLVNCAGDGLVYEAPRTAGVVRLWDKPGGRLVTNNSSSVDLLSGGRVVRTGQTVNTPDDTLWLRVKLLGGGTPGYQAWAPAASLVATTPSSGICGNGRDPKRNMSAAERDMAATKSLGAGWVSSTVQCVVGLGDGVEAEGQDLFEGMREFVHSLPALGRGAVSMLQDGLERQRDVVLAALGNDAALQRIKDAARSDMQRLQASLAAIAHVVTIVREYLEHEYYYFSELDAEHKAYYVCKLVGRLAFEVVLSVVTTGTMTAIRGGAEAGGLAASTLEKVEQANIAVAKVAEIPERVGTMGAVYVRQQEVFAQRFASQWEALRTAKDATTKKQLLRWFSGEGSNPLNELERNGHGNCGYAAIATIFSIGTGHPICPMAYLEDEIVDKIAPGTLHDGDLDELYEQLRRASSLEGRAAPVLVKEAGAPAYSASSAAHIEELLAGNFEEGQLGFLFSSSPGPAHATMITRIDGVLTVVNNQGWNEALGKGDDILQSFSQWDASWKKVTKSDVAYYQVMKTGFSLPN